MRTVYVPHLIRSASQAAELPPGTRAGGATIEKLMEAAARSRQGIYNALRRTR